MRKTLLLCVVFLMLCIGNTVFAQALSTPRRGVLRVKVQQELATQISTLPQTRAGGIVMTGITPLDRANQRVKAVKMERVFPYDPRNEERQRKHGLHLWYRVEFDEGFNPLEAKQLYGQVPGVTVAENILPMSLIGGDKGFVVMTESQLKSMSTRDSEMPFNDPFLNQQWHYSNDGSMAGSVKGADANVFKAWEIATGNKDLLVAIIDGGVDYLHKDLAANMWVNEKELNGTPGVDDDGNGFVDDIHGYNFVTKSGEVFPHDHGTHVAGTVAAVNNNGIGVAGVAGGNGQGGVRMISCQVFDSRSANADGDFAGAIVYAANQGAVIAQCSWGWGAPDYFEQAVLDAIDYFTEEAHSDFMKGGLCIFANGNTGDEAVYYPGAYEKVISVGAMTYDKKPASYSTRGDWCDITAPGGLLDYNSAQGVLSTFPGDKYGFNEGTSMATPHVSGIAALVLSKYGNKTFPNETLRQQLLTSVNDFYTDNPEAIGKFGSGYIDAYKALQMESGTAPDAVTDFTLAPAQDNILVEWIIPNSADKNVNYHMLYYSKEAFTADSDLTKIPHKTVDTKFNASGDQMSYEVDGLSPMTTYYIALQAVNRWGDMSPLSAVKSATTNAGPKLVLDQQSLSMQLDATQANVATAKFTISNEDAGLLRWNVSTRTSKVNISEKVTRPGTIAPFYGKMSAMPHSNYPVVSADYMAEDYPKSFTYSEAIYAYIGETDLSLPNSAAQLFVIDKDEHPQGFNLTSLNFAGFMGSDPIIRIYKGGSAISQATLLQEVKYDYFWHSFDVDLDEQIFFEPGESFWVVIHFGKNQKNPLGLGKRSDDSYKGYGFYSSNMGETWTQLNEVLNEGSFAEQADKAVWNITAICKNPDWSSMMKFTPKEGTVRANESQEVEVSNDGQKMINGEYSFNARLNTNESGVAEHVLPITFNVSGYKAELLTSKVVNFGDLLLGQEKTLAVEVVNKGYGKFGGDWGYIPAEYINCSSDQFEVSTNVTNFAARSISSFEITYKPTTEGSHTGTVTLTNEDGVSHSFVVRGVAAEPAKINVTPAAIDLGDLEVGGATIEKKITIKNEGKFPLEYVFPKYSDEKIDGMTKTAHKFGYSYITNLNGATDFEYDGNPELVNATDIASQFTDDVIWSQPIDLGFSFPYYGKEYSQIYIGSYGVFAVALDGYIHQCSIPTASPGCIQGLGLISGFGANRFRMGANSKVLCAKQNGKFVVKFVDVLALVYDQDYTPISFHMSLSPNGDVEFFYDDITPGDLFESGRGLFIGVNDIDVADPCTLTDFDCSDEANVFNNITAGSAVKFLAPGKSMIKSLSSASGVVAIGESQEITVKLAAEEGMFAGSLMNNLVLLSNDPNNNTSYITFTANIVGGTLKPAPALKASAIEFGEVFRTATVKQMVEVQNKGTDVLTITGIALANNKFTYEKRDLPFNIAPGTSADIVVSIPTEKEGEVADEMSITCGDGTVLKATLTGKVVGVPEAVVTPDKITETTPYGVNLNKKLSIKNSGNETLTYKIVPNEFITLSDQTTDKNSSLSYAYSASVDNENVEFSWVDIETNDRGVHHKLSYYLEHDFVPVNLPYEIPFYGKKYRKMYIYGPGFISFTELQDLAEFPGPPASLPTTHTLYKNLIAPYWGHHSMGELSTSGTYYAIEEDRVVVSFIDYGNSVNNGICFQALIYRNGNIKYQYKYTDADYAALTSLYGVVGMQNADATDGLTIPERCVKIDEAIELYPVKTAAVAAGETKEVDLIINANKLAGHYSTNLILNTNIPTKPVIDIPVDLTITGEAKPVFPEKLGGESVVGVFSPITWTVDFPFTIANNGTAPFTIKKIESGLVGTDPWENPTRLFYMGEVADGPGPLSTYAMGWVPYYEGNEEIVIGREPVQFRIGFDQYQEVADYDYPLVFTIETQGKTEQITVPFKLSITPAPAISFEQEEIRLSGVASDFVGEASVKMKNIGEYKLTYELILDPSGVGESAEDEDLGGGGVIPPMGLETWSKAADANICKSEVKSLKAKAATPDLPTEGEYTNSLYYPIVEGSKVTYNFGVGDKYSQFQAATMFQAPKEGFNLSHVYFLGLVGPLSNVDIKAEIIQGTDLKNGSLIGTGTLHVTEPDKEAGKDQSGNMMYYAAYRLLKLDKAVYLNQDEKFYVKLIFPAGYEYSVALVPKSDKVVENRYMALLPGADWQDVATHFEGSYGSLGFLMTCLEVESGAPWVKMLDTETSGELAPDASMDIKLQLNAKAARLEGSNKAVLVVKSNDPNAPVYNYPIYLDKNMAPVNNAPATTVYVKEGEQSSLDITIHDQEFENFTVAVADEKGFVKIEDATAVSTEDKLDIKKADDQNVEVKALAEATNGTGSGVTLKVVLAPDYASAGSYSFTLIAKDASNNTAKTTVNVAIENVNRAPVAKVKEDFELKLGETTPIVDYTEFFEDPDGDEMTYELSLSEKGIVDAYAASEGVILSGLKVGEVTVTIKATDSNNLSASMSFKVKVMLETGIGEVELKDAISIYPNPIVDKATIVCRVDAEKEISYKLYNSNGTLLYSESAVKSNGDSHIIDMTGYAAGVYYLSVTVDGTSTTLSVMKK